MEKFKVTPTNIATGAKAPYFVIELPINKNINNKSLAIDLAKGKSNLSKSVYFDFDCVQI